MLSNNSSYSIDIPIDIQNMNDKRAQMSIERLNLLLTNDEQENISNEYVIIKLEFLIFDKFRIDENLSVADKRNLFEIITKDKQIGGTLPRSKSFKKEE
jgi:hypothetical protein